MILTISSKKCYVCNHIVIVMSDSAMADTNFVLMFEWVEHLKLCMKARGY